MNWKKKTLLALLAATALGGVAVSASAEDWDVFGSWSPQANSYRSDGYYGAYADRYDQNRGYRNDAGRDGDRNYNRSYQGDRGYGGYWSWNRDTGYSQYNRGGDHTYGEHRHYESDDDD